MPENETPETLSFSDGRLILIDQTRLPAELVTLECTTVEQTHDAISRLVVRGAPAIGLAAAYGVCLAPGPSSQSYLDAIDYLATSRPTAVNLFWALNRMRGVVHRTDDAERHEALLSEARKIHEEDRQTCRDIGRHGASLLGDCRSVLTHCNAGRLVASMWGTALAPIYHLHQAGHRIEVFADETRPLLQGARLTAWELSRAGIPVTVLTDSMAGGLLRQAEWMRSSSAPTESPPMATSPIKSGPIRWPCWPAITASRSMSRPPRAPSTLRSSMVIRSRSKKGRGKRSRWRAGASSFLTKQP